MLRRCGLRLGMSEQEHEPEVEGCAAQEAEIRLQTSVLVRHTVQIRTVLWVGKVGTK